MGFFISDKNVVATLGVMLTALNQSSNCIIFQSMVIFDRTTWSLQKRNHDSFPMSAGIFWSQNLLVLLGNICNLTWLPACAQEWFQIGSSLQGCRLGWGIDISDLKWQPNHSDCLQQHSVLMFIHYNFLKYETSKDAIEWGEILDMALKFWENIDEKVCASHIMRYGFFK